MDLCFHVKQNVLHPPSEQVGACEGQRRSRPTWQHGLSCEDAGRDPGREEKEEERGETSRREGTKYVSKHLGLSVTMEIWFTD